MPPFRVLRRRVAVRIGFLAVLLPPTALNATGPLPPKWTTERDTTTSHLVPDQAPPQVEAVLDNLRRDLGLLESDGDPESAMMPGCRYRGPVTVRPAVLAHLRQANMLPRSAA